MAAQGSKRQLHRRLLPTQSRIRALSLLVFASLLVSALLLRVAAENPSQAGPAPAVSPKADESLSPEQNATAREAGTSLDSDQKGGGAGNNVTDSGIDFGIDVGTDTGTDAGSGGGSDGKAQDDGTTGVGDGAGGDGSNAGDGSNGGDGGNGGGGSEGAGDGVNSGTSLDDTGGLSTDGLTSPDDSSSSLLSSSSSSAPTSSPSNSSSSSSASASPSASAAASASLERKYSDAIAASYIVYLRALPAVLNYNGGIAGYPATSPSATPSTPSSSSFSPSPSSPQIDSSVFDMTSLKPSSLLVSPNSATGNAVAVAGVSSSSSSKRKSMLRGGAAVRRVRQRLRSRLRADVRLGSVKAFGDLLTRLHRDVAESVKLPLSRIFRSYTYTMNAFGARLTPKQVHKLRRHAAVAMVRPDRLVQQRTVHVPTFLELPATLWGSNGGQKKAGEGMIIGVVDSGIWPEHPSFDDAGYGPIPARWSGLCVNTSDFSGACNRKVIGARTYSAGLKTADVPIDFSADYASPRDNNGHGSWCSGYGGCSPGMAGVLSGYDWCFPGGAAAPAAGPARAGADASATWEFPEASPRLESHFPSLPPPSCSYRPAAAGNAGIQVRIGGTSYGAASGIAPRARIAMYKAMWKLVGYEGASGAMSDVYAAVDQAVSDGVDVVSISVGGGLGSYFDDVTFVTAAKAGVFAALAAGNQGMPPLSPSVFATIDNYSPFYLTVGASGTDRRYMATLTLGSGVQLQGLSWGGSNKQMTLVDGSSAVKPFASATKARLCYSTSLTASKVAGKILVCARGENTLGDKLQAATAAGAAALVIANVAGGVNNTVFLRAAIPVIHLNATASEALLKYISTGRLILPLSPTALPIHRATARLSAPYGVDNFLAPIIADFSSRGPVTNPALPPSPGIATNDILKPDVVGPGVNLWGPWRAQFPSSDPNNFGLLSGTSMATPQMAGIALLMLQKHPDWTPAQVISAMMSTATLRTNQGGPIPTGETGSVASPWDMGAGHINPRKVLDPGLTYNAGIRDFANFLAGQDAGKAAGLFSSLGNLSPIPAYNLNRASISVSRLKKTVTVVRTVTNVGNSMSTYRATVVPPSTASVSVWPTEFSIPQGGSVTYKVTITPIKVTNSFSFGSITWKDKQGHAVRSVIAVQTIS
ncbi:unnamed protein product [Closterium sp. NIES-53]